MKRITAVAVLSLALVGALFQSACSTTWVAEVDRLLAAIGPALVNVLQIVAIYEGKSADTTLEAKVTADANNLTTLANDLAAASTAAAPGVCAQTQAAAGALTGDAQLILQVVQVSSAGGTTNAKVVFEAADALVNTVVGLLPSCAAPPATAKATFLAKAQALDTKTLVRAYNAALTKRTGYALVDAYNKNHKLPVHGRFVHVLSLGIAK